MRNLHQKMRECGFTIARMGIFKMRDFVLKLIETL